MKSILFTYLILLSFVVQAQQIAQKPNYTEIGTLLKSPGENNLVNQLYQTGDTSNFMIQVKVLNGFIDALLQTGLGRSEENSIHVMAVTDEYVFLNILGLKYNSRKTQSPYDIFFLDENRYGLTEIYFDASVPLQNLNNMLNAKY